MGTVKEIRGIDEALAVPGVVQVSIVHGVGEHVGKIQSSVDRAGFVIAKGNTVHDAVLACEEGEAKIKVVFE